MPYMTYELDLSSSHSAEDTKVGLRDKGFLGKKIIVLSAPSECYIYLDRPSNDRIYCFQNLTIERRFEEIYVSNPSGGSGYLRLYIEYKEVES